MSRIRVMVAELFATYLDNTHFEVNAVLYDWNDAAGQLKDHTPDVVLLDINPHDEKDSI